MWLFGTGLLLLIGTLPSQGLYKRCGYLIALISYVQDFLLFFLRYMGLGMGKVYGTICGYYTQVQIFAGKKRIILHIFYAKSLKVHS